MTIQGHHEGGGGGGLSDRKASSPFASETLPRSRSLSRHATNGGALRDETQRLRGSQKLGFSFTENLKLCQLKIPYTEKRIPFVSLGANMWLKMKNKKKGQLAFTVEIRAIKNFVP